MPRRSMNAVFVPERVIIEVPRNYVEKFGDALLGRSFSELDIAKEQRQNCANESRVHRR
jgi:hypothetical protein